MESSMEYLTDLEGTQVTFDAVTEPPFNFPAQTWIILEKLDECSNRLTKEGIANDLGPSDTAGKFLCRPASAENENRRAFLRIYQQVPIAGTETKKTAIRASQAVEIPPPDHPELIAFQVFTRLDCDVVPKLLGYQQRRQDNDDGVPGGYVTYILWEKVPGESLDKDKFWRLSFSDRQAIRDKFRQVYTFLQFGYMPCMAGASKIIYDKSSGQMHISGFKLACPFEEPQKWGDHNYFQYGLIQHPNSRLYWKERRPTPRIGSKMSTAGHGK